MSFLPRLAACAFVGFLWIAPAVADNPPAAATTVEDALRLGLDLERERRWSEAIRHYEGFTRDYPDSTALQQRLLISRIHFDVDRRYRDASFEDAARSLSMGQALEMYDEVLQNLETYYVDAPSWQRLLRHGTAFLEVALTEPEFVEEHLADVPTEQIEQFRLNVHRHINNRPAASRHDLRSSAAHAAELARKQLGLSETATVLEYACGAIGLLDPYSRFLTGRQLDETMSSIEGNFVGLGVELKPIENRLEILDVIAGGPAEEGGMKAGMRIVAVNDVRTDENDPTYVADLLHGPEGSWVTVDIRDGAGAMRRLSLQRRRLEVPSVEAVEIVDTGAGIGYLRLTTFQKTTADDLDAALWKLNRSGMKSLIVDLRGNPGGLLPAAVEAADRFLDSGKIVSTRGRNIRENFVYQAHRTGTWRVPLYVLIDRDSASASEIFAGAILDHGRGTLVGERTYGKGSVQGIFRMESTHAGLCLTTAKFYSPLDHQISGAGVDPTEPVSAEEYVVLRPAADGSAEGEKTDVALNRAIELARGAATRLTQR